MGTPVANAFDPLEVMLPCVRRYPKFAARDRRLLAGRPLTSVTLMSIAPTMPREAPEHRRGRDAFRAVRWPRTPSSAPRWPNFCEGS
jgi:hypothetical protein